MHKRFMFFEISQMFDELVKNNPNRHPGEYPNHLKVARGHKCRGPESTVITGYRLSPVRRKETGMTKRDRYNEESVKLIFYEDINFD